MTVYRGAQQDLKSLIRTNLFILSPNNSGSTFLSNAIGLSKNVWSLYREGQHILGFSGPKTRGTKFPLIWAAKQEWVDYFLAPNAFDWQKNKKAWYFQATSTNFNAPIFMTKAPPFLLYAEQLVENFENTKFIFMVRNPYATVEGILRRQNVLKYDREELIQLAASHIIRCFGFQRKNIAKFKDQGTFFSYEFMCAEANEITSKIKTLVPDLTDLKLDQKISVKDMYDEPLRNMNDQQIEQLSAKDIKLINQEFEKHLDLLEYFGYALIKN